MAKDKNGKEINVGDFVKGRDGRSWKVKRIIGDELQFEMTSGGTFPASDYTVFNSCLNAKFKVGDKVKLPDGKIGTIEKVVSVGGKTDNIIKVPGMSMTSRRDDELTLANSSNPVVANAVAWKAKNAVWIVDSDDWGYEECRSEYEARKAMERLDNEGYHKGIKATEQSSGRVIHL